MFTPLSKVKENVDNYQTKKFQNKHGLDSTKHCQIWKIMVITYRLIAEFKVFKLLLCQIQENLDTRRLEFAEFGGL